jgi:hypothetical protein
MDVHGAARRYFGQLPAGAPKSVQLRWWRQVELKVAVPSLPAAIAGVILIDATWVYVVFGAFAVWWIWGHARLTREIRRARRAELAD